MHSNWLSSVELLQASNSMKTTWDQKVLNPFGTEMCRFLGNYLFCERDRIQSTRHKPTSNICSFAPKRSQHMEKQIARTNGDPIYGNRAVFFIPSCDPHMAQTCLYCLSSCSRSAAIWRNEKNRSNVSRGDKANM